MRHRDGVLAGGAGGGAAGKGVPEELAEMEPVEYETLGEAVAGGVGGHRGAGCVRVRRGRLAVSADGRAHLPVHTRQGVGGLVVVNVAAKQVRGVGRCRLEGEDHGVPAGGGIEAQLL